MIDPRQLKEHCDKYNIQQVDERKDERKPMKAQRIYGRLVRKYNDKLFVGSVNEFISGEHPAESHPFVVLRNVLNYNFMPDVQYIGQLDTNTNQYVVEHVFYVGF